jgi:hypothetical protein
MPNYQLSKIYKITSPQTDKCYVGASCQKYLSLRLSQHNRDFKQYCNGKYHYTTSFEIINYGDAKIELLETCPCNNSDELKVFEGKWIRQLDCVNNNIPDRTKQEYYETHKEHYKEQMKKYYIHNKNTLQKRNKQYRNDNKEKIKEQKSQLFICECGSKTQLTSKARHFKSEKHQKYLAKKS